MDYPLVGMLEEVHKMSTEVLTIHQDDLTMQIQIVSHFILEERHQKPLGAGMHPSSPHYIAVATRCCANFLRIQWQKLLRPPPEPGQTQL